MKKYSTVSCDRCARECNAYYTLSYMAKGLWVKCSECGVHAVSYISDLNLPWKPSKTFIKKVGIEEALRLAEEIEETGTVASRDDLYIPAIHGKRKVEKIKVFNHDKHEIETPRKKDAVLYCDAGTINNGQKGRQKTIVVVCDENSNVLREEWIGDYSNNEGEIIGIISCLEDFANGEEIEVRTDSKIAQGWANRGWTKAHAKRLKKGKLTERHRDLIGEANKLRKSTNSIITWIPRGKNLAGIYIEERHHI